MKLVFCGTPQFAVPTLEALVRDGHNIALVLAQPDKPVGRHGEVAPVPVKQAALAHNLPVQQPTSLRTNTALQQTLQSIAPEAIIVVAYGRILPQWMLDLPPHGCLNGHASLLPRWRGAAPIQWAIAGGDHETGVTTMRLDAGLDTGAMLLKKRIPITGTTTAPELFVSLAEIGARLMVETLARLASGTIAPEPQDDTQATLAPILTRDDARIDWLRPAKVTEQRFRGFQPWPGTHAMLRGKKLIVHAMALEADTVILGEPGTIAVRDGALVVQCGFSTALTLHELQLEGKKRMPAAEFLRGFQIGSGERLG